MSASIDFVDRKILKALLTKGRSTFAELASQVGLTAPTVHDRVKKLERAGVIKGYTAILNPSLLGYEISALVNITVAPNVSARDYEARLAQIPEIQECYSVAGEDDYVARVVTRSPRSLEALLQRIRSVHGTVNTKATVVLSSPISRNSLPLDEDVREFPNEKPSMARSQSAR